MFFPFVIAAACLAASPRAHAPVVSAEKGAKAMDAFLKDCEAFGWSGAVHVQRGKRVFLSKGYGLADDETGRACDEDTLFNVGTMTQALTATATLQLVERGSFELKTSVSDLFEGAPEAARDVTVGHLLRDASGWKGRSRVGREDAFDVALTKIFGDEPEGPPGEEFRPWPGGFIVLAGLAESRSDGSFEDLIRAEIFSKAGMESAGFVGDELPAVRQAIGYEPRAEPRLAGGPVGSSYGWKVRGSSGAVMTAADFAAFMVALESGKLGKGDAFDAGLRRGRGNRGFGWGINRDYQASCDRLEREGETLGFRSFASLNLGTGVISVVLSNRGECPARFMETILRNFVSGETLPIKQSIYPPRTLRWKSKDLDRLVGTWSDADGVEVELERYGETSLRARAYRTSLLASPAGGIAEPRRAVFAPIEKRALVAHAWAEAAEVSRLDWNGKAGKDGELTLTEPGGKKRVLRLL